MSEVKTTATHGGKTYPIQGSCDPKFQKVLDQFIAENERYLKLFDLYRKVTGDTRAYKRFDARRLRYQGAFLTHDGEDLCGEELKCQTWLTPSL